MADTSDHFSCALPTGWANRCHGQIVIGSDECQARCDGSCREQSWSKWKYRYRSGCQSEARWLYDFASGKRQHDDQQSDLAYDPVKDFAPITQISKFPLVLEVKADSKIKTLQEFIDYAKANPNKVTFGSAGSGSPQHLGPELLKKMAGISMQHVPYKGAGPAANDLLGGQIFSMVDITAGSMKYIQAGLLHPIAVTTATRSPALPNVPTMDEAGLKGFDYFAWHGIAVPAKTPVAVIDKLNKTLLEIFNDPDFRKKWEGIGSEIVAGTPQQFADLINSEAIRLGALVKDLNIQLD